MKLYNVPRNSKIMLSNGVVLLFHHIDGMYSVCTDENGDIYHISASEEVTIGVPVGIGGFATTTSTPAQPVQEQWLEAVSIKIEAALLSHRLSMHNDSDDAGNGFPLVDALCCGQTSLDIGKREVEDIVEAIYHVLDANIPTAPQPAQEPLTDKQILADETLRYYFGQNGGAGPVSKQGRKVVNAVEALHGIKEKNT